MPFVRRFFLWWGLSFIAAGSPDLMAQVVFLEQNWTPAVRQDFYTTSQGSRMMPYDWFLALESSDSQDSFVKVQLPKLGYLANSETANNPDELPVGFVMDENRITGERWIGLNCAACHTNQLQYAGQTYQIDGAPALTDMWEMLSGVNESLIATRNNPEKFSRFATKVLGNRASIRAKLKLEIELRRFTAYWNSFIDASRVPHSWGRGRLDAFGMIFNRVSSIDLGIPENSVKPDAPVSYPFLWGTSFQDRVQWNGIAENGNDIERLGRNVGEVLGVFAQAQFRSTQLLQLPENARTSAKRLNLVRLENHLKTLWSPLWPNQFGALDASKLAAGEKLYKKNCVHCHEIVPHKLQNTPVEVVMTPLSEVGTDAKMATNAATGEASTGNLKLLFMGRERIPRGELLQHLVRLSIISPYRDVQAPDAGIFDRLTSNDVFDSEEIKAFLREIGLGRSEAMALIEANHKKLESYFADLRSTIDELKSIDATALRAIDAPPTLKYKAAPLAGIWATAPYLHNGSVPNLYELLLPADQRSKTFHVGNREFDPAKVGYKTDPVPGSTLLDTSLPGNSNAGHDTYGEFTEEERWQLVEYMKSL